MTFVDGQVLTAAALNTLGAGIGIDVVRDHGADPTGLADSTAAIQAAITAAEAKTYGDTVVIPPGRYRITSALVITKAQRCNLIGHGRRLSTLRQHTANTPILSYADCTEGTGWTLAGLGLEYATAASGTDTNAVGIRFAAGTGNPGFGYYNFRMQDVRIEGCHTAIANTGGCNVWGWSWDNLEFRDYAAQWVNLDNGGAGGFPQSTGRNWYGLARSITYADTPAITFNAVDGLVLDTVELNNGTYTGTTGILAYIAGARSLAVRNARVEAISATSGATQSILFLAGVTADVSTLSLTTIAVSGGVVVAAVRCGSGASASVRGVQVTGITGAGAMCVGLEGTAGQFQVVESVQGVSGSWVGNGGYVAPRVEVASSGRTILNGIPIITGTGTPEGSVTAPVGSLFLRTNGGAGTTLYVKESGTGNTGWVAK